MDFQTAIITCFRKYATFKGRASRSEFWFFQLGILLLYLIIHIIDAAIPGQSIKRAFYSIWSIIVLLPILAVEVRRLHDVDRSGWVAFWYYISFNIFIAIAAFIIIMSRPRGSGGDDVEMILYFALVAVAGLVLGRIYLLTRPGTQGPNQYGDDPLAPTSHDDRQANYHALRTQEQNLTATDKLALLERLHALRQNDILTDAEFEGVKSRILTG